MKNLSHFEQIIHHLNIHHIEYDTTPNGLVYQGYYRYHYILKDDITTDGDVKDVIKRIDNNIQH